MRSNKSVEAEIVIACLLFVNFYDHLWVFICLPTYIVIEYLQSTSLNIM